MSQKMTLQEYIESRNYKRKLLSKSKSISKHQEQRLSPILNATNPSMITRGSDKKQEQKLSYSRQMSDLVNQIKDIDEEVEGFSLIHKKVEQIKQFTREYIHEDKIFVKFCKKIEELQSIYRLELIEAYRFQLFKYQFDNEKNLDEEKRKMIRQLNDLYMNSRFEYKKFILKEKNELTKSQKLVLQQVIQQKTKIDPSLKQTEQKENHLPNFLPTLQKNHPSFLQSLVMMGQNQGNLGTLTDLKKVNKVKSNYLSVAEYNSEKNKQKVRESNLFKEKTAKMNSHDIQPIVKASKQQRKAKEFIEQMQRQKILQLKDYLKVQRK